LYKTMKKIRDAQKKPMQFLANKVYPFNFLYVVGRYCQKWLEPIRHGLLQYKKHRRFFDESQWWQTSKLQEYQLSRLKKLVFHADTNVPYYRKLFQKNSISPEDINCIEDLKKIPIITKEDVIKNAQDLIAENISVRDFKRRANKRQTSGSTGKCMSLFIDDNFDCWRKAFHHWRYRLAEIPEGSKFIQFWSKPFIDACTNKDYFYEPYMGRLSLSSLPKDGNALDEYLRIIKRFKPAYCIGAPSFLFALAVYAGKQNVQDVRLNTVYSTYENIFPFQKKEIESRFNCRVLRFYNSEEHLVYAWDCATERQMHIESRAGIMEIVDNKGKPVPCGETGRIICTGFNNYLMPLLRYETGDIGSISEEKCPCGRGLPVLSALEGRTSEVLSVNGKKLFPAMLSVVVEKCRNIKECQFIQEPNGEITINIVKDADFDWENTRKLMSILQGVLGNNFQPKIIFLQKIPKTKAGKFQFVINRQKQSLPVLERADL